MKKILPGMSVALACFLVACVKYPVDTPASQVDCTGIDSHFAANVFPIIQSSCAADIGCHGNGSTNGPGALTSFTKISTVSSAIRNAIVSGSMPKAGRLSTQEKNTIICWVNSGTPNN